MASAANATLATNTAVESETIVGFSPTELRAPFLLRCAALSIDYLLLLIFPAGWLTLGRLLGEGTGTTIGRAVWIVGAIFFALNFLIFPLFRGQSIGKLFTGLTILNIDGTTPSIGRLLIRNTIGYLITVLTGGLGFLIAALNSTGRTLHDLLTGTIVVRGKKTSL